MSRISGSKEFFQEIKIFPAAGKWGYLNGDIQVLTPGSSLIPVGFKFFRVNTDWYACLTIVAVHTIDNIAVSTVTGGKVNSHQKVRHCIKKSLVINSRIWNAVRAFN